MSYWSSKENTNLSPPTQVINLNPQLRYAKWLSLPETATHIMLRYLQMILSPCGRAIRET